MCLTRSAPCTLSPFCSLGSLRSLKQLDASCNALEVLPARISELTGLTSLKVRFAQRVARACASQRVPGLAALCWGKVLLL